MKKCESLFCGGRYGIMTIILLTLINGYALAQGQGAWSVAGPGGSNTVFDAISHRVLRSEKGTRPGRNHSSFYRNSTGSENWSATGGVDWIILEFVAYVFLTRCMVE